MDLFAVFSMFICQFVRAMFRKFGYTLVGHWGLITILSVTFIPGFAFALKPARCVDTVGAGQMTATVVDSTFIVIFAALTIT